MEVIYEEFKRFLIFRNPDQNPGRGYKLFTNLLKKSVSEFSMHRSEVLPVIRQLGVGLKSKFHRH